MNAAHAVEATGAPTIDVLAYQDLVRAIAHNIHRRLPPSVEVADLVNTGMVGLLTAVKRFDPSRGVPFQSFARFYIQGAIMDSLRDADWVPRAVRRKAQRIEREANALYQRSGITPSGDQIATRLELSKDQFHTMQRDAQIVRLTSFDQPLGEEAGATIGDLVPTADRGAEEEAIDAERRDALLAAVQGLPERERIAVSLYFFRGMSLKEIGVVLGVSESRVCQLRTAGTRRLRKRLAGL